MRVVLWGCVTAAHLTEASLFAGIYPESFVTNGAFNPPAPLATYIIVPDPLLPETAVAQNNWRLVLAADALVCCGENPHLVQCAEQNGLLVYQF